MLTENKLENPEKECSVYSIPWEDRPDGHCDVLWRFSQNPVIARDELLTSNSIFNSAIVPFGEGFAGVFRCDDKQRKMNLHSGWSRDGVKWNINPNPINFIAESPCMKITESYDPRVCKIGDCYYITWCNCFNGPTIGVGYTYDFQKFYQLENAFVPFNRNGVLFPKKINGKYAMLSRPSGPGHNDFGDIYYSESPDMCHWGCHRFVMGCNPTGWDSTKIGPGPVPIETEEGWLLIYHGVLTSCSGFVYSMGAALLDLEEPWKVVYRAKPYILSPQKLYECVGDVPNVVFPCATLHDKSTGRVAIYYGCADTVTGIAFCYLDELVEFIKATS